MPCLQFHDRFFNPPPPFVPDHKPKDDKLLADCLAELDVVAGCAGNAPLWLDPLQRWTAGFVLSGATVGGARQIWRLSCNATTACVPKSEAPLVFSVPRMDGSGGVGDRIAFAAGAAVFTPSAPVSTGGVWVSAPVDAPVPVITKNE